MKKILCLLLLTVSFSLAASAKPLYKYEDTYDITNSVSYTQVREFYVDHNISYSYIRIDLGDEDISFELLKGQNADDLLTVGDLAKTEENVIAAINTDFFSAYTSNTGFSLGIEIKDGELLQSPVYPETMATLAFDGRDVLMSYLNFSMEVVAPNGNRNAVRHLNKHTSYYGDILMYTSDFNGGKSPAVGGEVLEVVVEDGKIKEFRRNQPSVDIPENGYVLVVSEGVNMFFANNFEVGDEIEIDIKISPELSDFETAVGGGTLLVSKGEDVGKVGDYTHTVAGYHPRSAIGIDKKGKTLFLVAVDGRQTSSRGMMTSHLAELMIDLGCYTAINFDGGGSSRLLASTYWQEELHAINKPTSDRKIINAIGLVHNPVDDDEKRVPAGIKLSAESDSVFVGQKVKIELAVHDCYMRPVEYDKEKIEWSATGGKIENGVFVPSKGGMATISATLGELYADTQILVVDNVSGIDVERRVEMEIGDTHKLDINVFDYNGKNVDVLDVSTFSIVSSDEDVVKIEGDVIEAVGDGTAVVSVSKNGVSTYISVSVGRNKFDYYNSFEKLSGTVSRYPEDTKGDFVITNQVSLDGKLSGKFVYDYTVEELENTHTDEDNPIISFEQTQKDDVAKAIYYAPDNEDINIDNSCGTINIFAYSDTEFMHKIRAQVKDAEGKVHLIDFEGELNEGVWWAELSAKISDDIPRPVKLSRVYVVYTPGEVQDKGELYVDGLSFVSYVPYKIDKVTPAVYRTNALNNGVEYSLRIGTLSDKEKVLPTNVAADESVKSFVRGGGNGMIIGNGEGHSIGEDANAVYIRLNVTREGIRASGASQWQNMDRIISETKKQYVFILSDNSIFGEDEFENEVIIDYLSTCGKEVFVITSDDHASYKEIEGIKFFTLDNTAETTLSLNRVKSQNCIEFLFGDTVTFRFVER